MKPKQPTARKKAEDVDQHSLEAYYQYWHDREKRCSQADPNFKKGSEINQRMQRKMVLLQRGGDISETELPLWVRELYRKLGLFIPGSSPEVIGQYAGIHLSLALAIWNDLGAEARAGTLTSEEQAYLEEGTLLFQCVQVAWTQALASSPKNTIAFFEGLAEGLKKHFDRSGQMVLTEATPLHWVLLQNWPQVAQQRSVSELYTCLQSFNILHDHALNDLPRLQQICKRLKLKLKGRGRPKASPLK